MCTRYKAARDIHAGIVRWCLNVKFKQLHVHAVATTESLHTDIFSVGACNAIEFPVLQSDHQHLNNLEHAWRFDNKVVGSLEACQFNQIKRIVLW